MKSALPGGPLDRERPEFLPIFAAIALVVSLVAQFLLPGAQQLSEGSALAPRRPRPVTAPVVPAYPAILQAPIFSPDRKPGASDEAPTVVALNGFVAVGVAMGHNFATAVIKGPDGAIRTMRKGDSLQDWRLVGIESSRLTFERDTARHELPVGAPAAAAATSQNGNEE